MKIRALDDSGDWLWGQGLQSYNYGSAAIEENLQTSLYCFLNDCFWNLSFGVDWWNLLGAKNPAAQANILLQTRQVISNSYGVTKINSVGAVFVSLTRALTINYNLNDIFSTTLTGSVSIPS
jgi:hypothetical protein